MRREHDFPQPAGKDERAGWRGDRSRSTPRGRGDMGPYRKSPINVVSMADEFKQVTFTHQSADAYAAVELVGDYLFAARIINRKLMPSRDQIGVLVDYGCGAGKSTRGVAGCAREGGRVVGVDISNAMLDHARTLTKKAASKLPKVSFEFLQIVDDSIPLPRASADAVMTCAV